MPPPKLIHTTAELRQVLAPLRAAGRRIGLVPTMGALHEGHLSLVRAAAAECRVVVVSIYVNPSQFGPAEDYARYPRTLPQDLAALSGVKADVVFVPGDAEVYPAGFQTWVELGGPSAPLEGQRRPGHFRGVATVVLKLLNMVQPDVAYFGQKDYQQTVVVRRMVEDLNVPVAIRVCATVREPDGLAMSSRNAYLSADERRQAVVLWESLKLAGRLVAEGQRDAAAVIEQLRRQIALAPDARIDYVAVVDPDTLEDVATIAGPAVAAVAVAFGQTRLIDNCLLAPGADVDVGWDERSEPHQNPVRSDL